MQRPRILMLEHDQDDRYISREFFAKVKDNIELDFVLSTNELLSNLLTKPLPALILMNQQAAPENTIVLVKELKSRHEYRHIPIVVLGNMPHGDTTREYYEAGVNSYIQKPVTYQDTQAKIESFIQYWFQTVALS